MEKIDIHSGNNNLEKRKASVKNFKTSENNKRDLLEFIQDLGMGKVNRGKRLNDRTLVKYITMLKISLEYFQKDVTKLSLNDIEGFENAIVSNELKANKKPYANSMKTDIRKHLKIFFKWKLGSDKANKLVGWLDTRDIKKTPDYLKESEIEKLYKSSKNPREAYIISVLFDSGCRAEEFLNIRYEDIELTDDKNNFVKITLKSEYSKTEGRVISLFWKFSNEAVKDFVNERVREGIKSTDPVLDIKYDNLRFFLRRIGLRVLNKTLNPHLFRHSSATYYATKLNRQELCYRYGWKFSSDMPDVYISRSGMLSKDIEERFIKTEVSELKNEIEKLKFDKARKDRFFETSIKDLSTHLKKILLNIETINKKTFHKLTDDKKSELRELFREIDKG